MESIGVVDAVIVAAGASTRFGGLDKVAAALAGKSVLAWSLEAFEACPSVGAIVVVTSADHLESVAALGRTHAPLKFRCAVPGGLRRRDSVEAGLRALTSRLAAIHDGARPLVTVDMIERCIAAAGRGPGAIVAVPVTDTIKVVRDGRIESHPDRTALWAAQTPQVVLRQAWLDAAAAGDGDETDDAAMLSRLGLECAVVEGSVENLKITRPLDLEVAAAVLRARAASAKGAER